MFWRCSDVASPYQNTQAHTEEVLCCSLGQVSAYFYHLQYPASFKQSHVLTFPDTNHSLCLHSYTATFIQHNTHTNLERKTVKSESTGSYLLFKMYNSRLLFTLCFTLIFFPQITLDYVFISFSCTETVWRWQCETNVLQCHDTVH